MLIISFRPDNTISSMGIVVGSTPSEAFIHYCATDEDAIAYVAELNANNDSEARAFTHCFVYPDDCPEGGLLMRSIINIDLRDIYEKIPTHLLEQLKQREVEYVKIRKEREIRQRKLDQTRREQKQKEDDLRTFENLRKKLGK